MPNSEPQPPLSTDTLTLEQPIPKKAAKPKKANTLLLVVGGVVFVMLLGGAGVGAYFYNEWKTIASILDQKTQRRREELTQSKKISDLSTKYFSESLADQLSSASAQKDDKKPAKKMTVDDISMDEVLAPFQTFDKNMLLFEDAFSVYTDLIEANAQKAANQTNQLKMIVGPTKNLLSELIATSNKFYELDIEDNNISKGSIALQHNILLMTENNARVGVFTLKTNGLEDPEIVSENFSSLAPLEKYTKSDFSYKNQDYIAKYYPEGLEKLDLTKGFLKNYYLAVKDFASNDIESAAYKFSRLGDDSAKVQGIDFEAILKSRKDESVKMHQDIVKELLKEYELSEKLAAKLVFFKTDWKPSDLACSIMMYKLSGYAALKEDYPKVDSIDVLYTELEEMSPSLAVIESTIKESISVRKDDKKLYMNCKDLNMEWDYEFKEDKDKEEAND